MPHLDRIRDLYCECKGNIVRVGEELEARYGVDISYSTLTAFCRRNGIGVKPKKAAGFYHFAPGEEMQHDTSPHKVKIGGKRRSLQCASLVLCYSRMIFAQLFTHFNRFICKIFLTDAFRFFGGTAARCMIDNTSVVIAHGTGANAVPAPEMKAFADRFDFDFVAHEIGDANRSARVERPFRYIETNFYPGRTFNNLEDANTKLIAWCRRANSKFKRTIQSKPIELFQAERLQIRQLPVYIPEVYDLHHRIVDIQGFVTIHNNRYSVPDEFICQRVQVRETKKQIRIFRGHKLIAEHMRQEKGAWMRIVLPGHRQGRQHKSGQKAFTIPEEQVLHNVSPEMTKLVGAIKAKYGRSVRRIQRLHRMYLEYPTEALNKAISVAIEHGLLDLERIERMVLRNIAGDFFQLPSY